MTIDPRKYTFQGKSVDQMTVADVDNLRYTRGEHLRLLNELNESIKDSESKKLIEKNKRGKKKNADTFDREIREVNERIKEIDQEIDEILRMYAGELLDDLEHFKKRRKELQDEKKADLKTFDDANANMLVNLGELEQKRDNAQEQTDIMQAMINLAETLIDKKRHAPPAAPEPDPDPDDDDLEYPTLIEGVCYHNKSLMNRKGVTCQLCGKVFKNYTDERADVQRQIRQRTCLHPNTDPLYANGRGFKCVECGASFKTVKALAHSSLENSKRSTQEKQS